MRRHGFIINILLSVAKGNGNSVFFALFLRATLDVQCAPPPPSAAFCVNSVAFFAPAWYNVRTMSEIAAAFSAFSKKLSRFVKSESPTPGPRVRADELTQRRIMEADEAFSAAVIRTYTKYRFPFKTLGEQSVEALAISRDEDALLAAYRLFRAVQDANEQYGTDQTRIRDDMIASPLANKTAYTQGDDFVYLQCWLRYEQDVTDIVPRFVPNRDGSYTLQFVPEAEYHADFRKKEMAAVIQEAFYP